MRNAGILLHISSLPSQQGIGTLGDGAYRFVDFLAAAGQTYWQMLPVGPTGFGDSPYQPFSAFAGNPFFIDAVRLQQQGLVTDEERQELCRLPRDHVDYGGVYGALMPLLRKAYARFAPGEDYSGFVEMNRYWLWDFGLYMALKEHFDHKPWMEWPRDIKYRTPAALEEYHRLLEDKIGFYLFVQYEFFCQLRELVEYAEEKGVHLIGDMPIYIALDSADTWVHREELQLDEEGYPTQVAGCPPDGYSPTGQLWGNPLYRWDVMKEDGYDWWVKRISHQAAFFHRVRIDHFRGFEAYFSIPAHAQTAEGGHWEEGPGMDFFRALEKNVPKGVLIAEDLGFLTKEVEVLLEETGFPGMSVLQFAFYEGSVSKYLPHNLKPHSILYTGTHDNDTTVGWLGAMTARDKNYLFEYLGIYNEYEAADRLLRTAMTSVCETVVISMQDVLFLGGEARMNTPGVASGNWQWRVDPAVFTEELQKAYRRRTQLGDRLPRGAATQS